MQPVWLQGRRWGNTLKLNKAFRSWFLFQPTPTSSHQEQLSNLNQARLNLWSRPETKKKRTKWTKASRIFLHLAMKSARGAFLKRDHVADQKDERGRNRIAHVPTVAPGGKRNYAQGSIIAASVVKCSVFGGTTRRTWWTTRAGGPIVALNAASPL